MIRVIRSNPIFLASLSLAILLAGRSVSGANLCAGLFNESLRYEISQTEELRQRAENLVLRQIDVFDRSFEAGSGYTFERFEKLIRDKSKIMPAVAQTLRIVEEGQIEVYMRAPESVRDGIVQRGFLNQHQTNTSMGLVNIDARMEAEAGMLAMTKEDYRAIESEIRPKYASFRLPLSQGAGFDIRSTRQYGDDVFIFRKDALKGRAAFFPGDSLGHFFEEGEGLMPHRKNVPWHQLSIPLERSMLMVPYLLNTVEYRNPNNRPGFPQYPFDLKNQRVMGHDYWEIHLFGPYTLADVVAYEFEKTPPSGLFLEALQKNGVMIFDARTRPATPWNGR